MDETRISKVIRQVSKGGNLDSAVALAQRDAEHQAMALGQPLPGFRVFVTVEQDFIPKERT